MPKRVKLTLEELKKAEPLPHFYDGSWGVEDPTILAWIISNADKWKPRRVKSKGRWIEPVEYNGFEYLGAVWLFDGRIYLVDEEAYSILHDATGEKTANELIFDLILEGVEYIKKTQGSNHELVKIIEQGDYGNEKLQSLLALYYRHLAMLKEKGLIIYLIPRASALHTHSSKRWPDILYHPSNPFSSNFIYFLCSFHCYTDLFLSW